MVIATVTLYKTPFSKENRFFPVGTLTSYQSVTVDEVTCTNDLVQVLVLDVSTFSGDWNDYNMCKIGSDYYWITGARTSTKYNYESIEFQLEFNAVTTKISKGESVQAWYDRAPIRSRNIPFTIGDDTLEPSRKVNLNKLPIYDDPSTDTDQLYYVQVTASEYVASTNIQSRMTRYAFFCRCDTNTDATDGFLSTKKRVNAPNGTPYPSMNQIINDIDQIMGINAASVLDISISVRCPYQIIYSAGTGSLTILNMNKNSSIPVQVRAWNDGLFDRTASYLVIDPIVDESLPESTTNGSFPCPENPYTKSISLNGFEEDCGRLSLADNFGNIMYDIPMQTGIRSIECFTYSDFTGVYTTIKVGEHTLTFAEGHIPWVGDAWNQYAVTMKDSDRDALNFALNQAKDQRNIDMLNTVSGSVLNGAVAGGLKGGPAGAAVGLISGITSMVTGVISAEANKRMQERSLRFTQEQKERQIKNSPSPNMNVGYGFEYVNKTALYNLAGLVLSLPSQLNISDYNSFVTEFGYPADTLMNVTFNGTGFVKGRIVNPTELGAKGQWLNIEFVEGFKFVTTT